MAERFRIENKGNVHCNGMKTSFKAFEYDATQRAYVFRGEFFAAGWDCTDAQCVSAVTEQLHDED